MEIERLNEKQTDSRRYREIDRETDRGGDRANERKTEAKTDRYKE